MEESETRWMVGLRTRWMVGLRDRGPSHMMLTGPIKVHHGEPPELVARALGQRGHELAYLFTGPRPPAIQDLADRIHTGLSIVELDAVVEMYSMPQAPP